MDNFIVFFMGNIHNFTTAAKKSKAVTVHVASEPEETVGTDCIASRTRQRRGVLTKAQISGPLELQDSPNLVRSGVPDSFCLVLHH